MPLSSVQKGAIGQYAFLAAALATGNGELEIYIPAADNEGRDAEVRRHLQSKPAIGIQIKVAFWLDVRKGSGMRLLRIRIYVPKHRVQKDPRLWFFIAHYELSQLGYGDPVYLISAKDLFEKFGKWTDSRGNVVVQVEANVSPESHDAFSPYRVALRDLGARLIQIIDETPYSASAAVEPLPMDGLWVSRAVVKGLKGGRTTKRDRKYDMIRRAVLNLDSLSGWYQGHQRLLSPVLLGTKAGEPHVLGYQFGGTSDEPLAPEGSSKNWRCLRVSELTRVKVLPGVWHTVPSGKVFQNCIDQVDVAAGQAAVMRRLRRAA
jgi:hypothetical protein